MSLVKKARQVQYTLQAEFIINVGTDSVVDVNGVTKNFKDAAPVFNAIGLPPNAVVLGGDVTVEAVSDDSGTATIAVGDSASASRYLSATTIKSLARTALVPTGYRGVGEDIQITLANAGGNATVGKVSIRVAYIITGRANENQIT